MDEFTHEIDELLISLNSAETDEWEGGLLCTPENRITVMNWLDKHYRLTPRALDVDTVCPNCGYQVSALICTKCGTPIPATQVT